MVHCCEACFFEMFWCQQMQKMVRCLLHDLSNCLTGNLALSELYCAKNQDVASENLTIIRDNCYKERDVLQQLSLLQHRMPGNVVYIDLPAFIRDLQPLFMRLLPAHSKFYWNHSEPLEALIKFDPALLQRIFLLTIFLQTEAFENVPNPTLNRSIVYKNGSASCRIKSNVLLNLDTEVLPEICSENVSLPQIYVPVMQFYLRKYNGSFSYAKTPETTSTINLTFPIVA